VAAARGCEVTVVEATPGPLWGPLGPAVSDEVLRRHEASGVRFEVGRAVSSLDQVGAVAVAELEDGTRLEADVVVEAVGSVPDTTWLVGNGLDLSDGVLCDEALRVLNNDGPLAHVVVVGDLARWPNPRYGGPPRRVEHWNLAADMAAGAATTLLAGLGVGAARPVVCDPVPSFWSDQGVLRLNALGVPSLGLDEVRLLEGDPAEGAVFGYHRGGELVGVVLIGLAQRMRHYRQLLGEGAAGVPA
jgi:3-phenylpropionate/trans-cinnamate dioxygenase ferredoxin reductase component